LLPPGLANGQECSGALHPKVKRQDVPPKFIEIEGKRLWRDVLQLRRAQVADGTVEPGPEH
jgi:hypothetical protein